ncbi:MAG: histidinol-phosphate transaminase [Victivallaceae bacterium]|nr:histidinol-phosphate transaminase [Victivallaceae bacterium]
MKKSYFRPEIDAMSGYAPGGQPVMENLVKLNTNENPFPPSGNVIRALREFDSSSLRRYPDPASNRLRDAVAARWGYRRENVIVGNGSDDLLTMIFRAFTAPDKPMAMLFPSYSLYAELAAMQNAPVVRLPLAPRTFALPENLLERIADCNLLMLTRPNAPTGTLFPRAEVERICREFDGIVVIDEAYADFAPDNCMDLVGKFANVIVMRTFSKSFSLAGLRLGYAVADPVVVQGLMKLKDSYNSDRLAQLLGEAAFSDGETLAKHCREICAERERLACALRGIGFFVADSAANFLFASPPDRDGRRCFEEVRRRAVIVRYFPGDATGEYVRITIGTPRENRILVDFLREIYGK